MAAAVVAVRDVPESEFVKNNGVLRQRRDRLVELLSSVKGVVCPKTQGAFYLFIFSFIVFSTITAFEN